MIAASRAVIAAFVLLAAGGAHAQVPSSDTRTIKVRPGDTLELLAAEYYGDRKAVIFIIAANNMEHARALKPDERLKIPMSREITSAPGDTFESLAATYLGDARRGASLAEFNRRSPTDSLPGGTLLFVPFAVPHVARSTEPIASIARAYFGADGAR